MPRVRQLSAHYLTVHQLCFTLPRNAAGLSIRPFSQQQVFKESAYAFDVRPPSTYVRRCAHWGYSSPPHLFSYDSLAVRVE